MFFAIYLLICGIVLPIVVGFIIFKKLKERSKPSNERNFQKDEQQS